MCTTLEWIERTDLFQDPPFRKSGTSWDGLYGVAKADHWKPAQKEQAQDPSR